MLEFILFLSADEKEILALIKKANFTFEENSAICLIGDKFFGFLNKRRRAVIICTQNAKKVTGFSIPRAYDEEPYHTQFHIRRTLRHEAVHVAQACNKNRPLNLFNLKTKKLSSFKLKAFEGSTLISGNAEKELEAYLMEEKPGLIKKALKEYCF